MPTEYIHRFVPGTTPVTLLVLHGTGGDENDLLPVGRALAPGASVLSPRGNVSENGNARFFARLRPGVDDENEVRSRVAELAEWILDAAGRYRLNPGNIFVLGYSNGAHTAAALMLLHPGVIAGGILLRPVPVIRPEPLPDLKNAPILIVAGKDDQVTPAQQGEELGRLLTDAGAAVDLAMQTAGHELTPNDFAIGRQWFGEILQPGR